MRKYIGTKLIEAEPAHAYQCTDEGGKTVIFSRSDDAPRHSCIVAGYRVRYPDGYESWSPKDVFEKAYLPLSINENLRSEAPSIGADMVDEFISSVHTITLGDKTTVVRAVLRNGFEIVEASSCVSPENYDEAIGRDICLEKIKDKVWMLLGFLLQTAVNGI